MSSQRSGLRSASFKHQGEVSRTPAGQAETRPVIDLVHLSRQTLGDRDLEMELLALFARQARTALKTLMAAASEQEQMAPWSGDVFHTLCGSARAVGCWTVAAEAHLLEAEVREAAAEGAALPHRDRLAALRDGIMQACAAIDDLLQDQDQAA